MNSILRRRRALMGANAGGDTLHLSDIDDGTGVIFGEQQFIVVSKDQSVVTLLRDKILASRKYMSASGDIDYDGSVIDTYLTDTYLPSFSNKLRNYLTLYSFSYNAVISGVKTAKTISRVCAIPSYANVNSGWLSALKTYYGTTDANTSRKAKSGETATAYWTMNVNGNDLTKLWMVANTGSMITSGATSTHGIRPVLYASPNTLIKLINGVYTVV